MKSVVCLSLALACFFAGAAGAQTYTAPGSVTSFTMVGTTLQVHSINRTFLFDNRLQHWGDNEPTRVLVQLDVDTTQRDDAEGFEKDSVTATAWRIENSLKRRKLWSVTEPGDMGEIESSQPFFIVRQPGCCGSRDSFTAFALYSARRLFTATGINSYDCWATLEVPNSHGLYRYIALHAAYSATDDSFGSQKNTVGLLTYAAPDKPLARYRLLAKDQTSVDQFMGEAVVRLVADDKPEETNDLTLWSSDKRTDPKAIGKFSIHVNLAPGNTVIIPVMGDKLDISKAQLPAGLTIEPTDLP